MKSRLQLNSKSVQCITLSLHHLDEYLKSNSAFAFQLRSKNVQKSITITFQEDPLNRSPLDNDIHEMFS